MVPSSAASSPAPAVGSPLVRSGGQMLAQAPAHALRAPLSASNRYRVRPWASARTVPRPVRASVTDGPPADAGAGRAAVPYVRPLPPPLPQPARASAIVPATRTAMVVRDLVLMVSLLGSRCTSTDAGPRTAIPKL